METSSIVLLAVSASISFALGRVVVHFRNKKRKAESEQAQTRQAQALRDKPVGPPSKNKAKRKRQLLEAQRSKNSEAP